MKTLALPVKQAQDQMKLQTQLRDMIIKKQAKVRSKREKVRRLMEDIALLQKAQEEMIPATGNEKYLKKKVRLAGVDVINEAMANRLFRSGRFTSPRGIKHVAARCGIKCNFRDDQVIARPRSRPLAAAIPRP